MHRPPRALVASLATLLLPALAPLAPSQGLAASETENHGLRVLPAPGAMTIDGDLGDWDLSGGLFACGEVEHLRDRCSLWLHAQYDDTNLYVAARWRDPTPINNPEKVGGHGFNGDCLQLRFVTALDTPQVTCTWWTAWRDANGVSVIDRASPGVRNGFPENPMPALVDAGVEGAKQAFKADADGQGYVQELVIPWKMLGGTGARPEVGGRFRMTVEPNFTAGQYGRITIKDLFDPRIAAPDRVFTFRAWRHWGLATIEAKGGVAPQPVRLADGRTFPTTMRDGTPAVNWDGLERSFEWPGFKPISWTMPFDGYASLELLDAEGTVVRHLVNWEKRSAGPQQVAWDGLDDAVYRSPGRPLPAGTYTWKAIAHPGASLTLRGWATAGNSPWISSPTDYWLGDHGVPTAVAGDGKDMFIACNGAEGGRHLLKIDLQGNVVWGLQNTTGAGDPESIAFADGVVYVQHPRSGGSGADAALLSRVDAATGAYAPWPKGTNHLLTGADIWGPGIGAGPSVLRAVDARDGNLYVTAAPITLLPDEIRDWTKLVAAIQADAGLNQRVLAPLSKRDRDELAKFAAGTADAVRATARGGIATRVIEALNAVITDRQDEDAEGEPDAVDEDLRRQDARRALDKLLGDAVVPAQHLLAVLDPQSGRARLRIPLEHPGAVRAVAPDKVLVACGRKLVAVDPGTAKVTTLAENLGLIRGLAVDKAGRIYASLAGSDNQVVVLSSSGKEERRIGRAGGRPAVGRFQADGLYQPAGLALAPDGNLWVMERDAHPKRVSVWNDQGALQRQFFGPTQYGASGSAIDPRDPNRMVGVGCEWQMDPATGRSECLGTFDHAYHGFATFREFQGRQFLYVYEGKYTVGKVKVFERVGYDAGAKHGAYALRAVLRPAVADRTVGEAILWTDANGDEQEQPDEIQRRPGHLVASGPLGWSLNLGPDLALYAWDRGDKALKKLPLAGLTACGAPRYDLAAPLALPPEFSNGYNENDSCAVPSADNRAILINQKIKDKDGRYDFLWSTFDLTSGKRTSTYPNPFFHVHGSHKAPASEAGLFRGAYGIVGSASLPGVGSFWVINGNLGEWYVLNSAGFFVSRLFSGNVFEWVWPKPAPGADLTRLPPGSGGEDFGGSITQGADGAVYVQAGKMAVWNLLLGGLDKTVAIPGGTVELTTADIAKAQALREEALQRAAASSTLAIPVATPAFSGKLDADFKAPKTAFKKTDDAAVRCALTHDAQKLYVAWEVKDPTPWVNGATEFAQMYAAGDTVDLQLGSDPKADPKRTKAVPGDLRLSIGNLGGKPTAVLYRFVSDEKKARRFSSGVITNWQVDYVDVLAEAEIKVTVTAGSGYLVEAAIPLASIGLTAKPGISIRGDIGVTHGDPGGTRTRLRTYWSNQQTGLVDDVVFELQPTPANWGTLVIE